MSYLPQLDAEELADIDLDENEEELEVDLQDCENILSYIFCLEPLPDSEEVRTPGKADGKERYWGDKEELVIPDTRKITDSIKKKILGLIPGKKKAILCRDVDIPTAQALPKPIVKAAPAEILEV